MSGGMAVESPTTDEELVSDNPHRDHEPNIKVDPLVVAMGRHNESAPENVSEAKGSSYELYGQRLMGMSVPLSPTTSNNPRHSHNHTTNTVINTSHFLRTCGLCKCRLAPDRRDIYMYRYVHEYWVFTSLTFITYIYGISYQSKVSILTREGRCLKHLGILIV